MKMVKPNFTFKMKRFITFLYWLRYFFTNIPTTDQALKMGLTHYENLYGEHINMLNCRSIWVDDYDKGYFCSELYETPNEFK